MLQQFKLFNFPYYWFKFSSRSIWTCLRAGALAAPMYFVEERVVALVKKTLIKVFSQLKSVCCNLDDRILPRIRFNCELVVNLAMILTVMSWIGASLQVLRVSLLPLVWRSMPTLWAYSRGNALGCLTQTGHGYDRAYNTIFDSNLTTFLSFCLQLVQAQLKVSP